MFEEHINVTIMLYNNYSINSIVLLIFVRFLGEFSVGVLGFPTG